MNRIHEVVDVKALCEGYIIRDGYVFVPLTYPSNVFDAILIRNPKEAKSFSPIFPYSTRELDEHIALVNELKLEKAVIIAENIDFIHECPSLRHLRIIPADNAGDGFDYSPLYDMPEIKSLSCTTIYGRKDKFSTTIDCSRIKGIRRIGVYGKGYLNYENITTIRSLHFSYCKKPDLQNLFSSVEIDTLSLILCKLKSLEGIQKSEKMQCVYLAYNNSLRDISALLKVKKTLRALQIDHCPKIEDFSVLGELENLEFLELSGNNEIPSLNFIKKLKKLKTFKFSVKVTDGDLSPCLGLSFVRSIRNRKHYNLKDDDLPKGKYVHGNETIEEWRRLEW